MKVSLTRWAAWSPGIETEDAWRAWARAPGPLAKQGAPDAKFLPAMLRRRCTPLTRTMLAAAWACLDAEELPRLRSVFASRHGSINESIGLLENVARREKLSPATFSHTVHNAQAALFSIAAQNRAASSSLSAQEDTWACAWVEALTFLERDPSAPVLVVIGDVPLADTFAPLVDEPAVPYAFACRLASAADGPGVTLSLADASQPLPRPPGRTRSSSCAGGSPTSPRLFRARAPRATPSSGPKAGAPGRYASRGGVGSRAGPSRCSRPGTSARADDRRGRRSRS
jgi:hypothetical protein